MKPLHKFMVILLLLVVAVQCLTSMLNNYMCGDEPYHIASGYSKLKTGDYRLLPEDGPLEPVISAFPLLFMNISFPFDHPSWEVKDMDVLMPVFFFEYNQNPYWIIFWSRIPMILLSLLLGYYVFRWAKELYGVKAGIFALFLYSFSPDILAHGQISSSDFGFAVFGTISLYYLWKFIQKPSWQSLLVAGFTLGLAQLTKFSAVFLLPIYFLVIIIVALSTKSRIVLRSKSYAKSEKKASAYNAGPHFLLTKRIENSWLDPRLKLATSLIFSFLIMLLVAYLVILAAYKFEGVGVPLAESISKDIHINREVYDIESLYKSNSLVSFAFEKIPSPLPYYFIRGLGYTILNTRGTAPSLVGEETLITKPYFFIYAFLVKTPIALLMFFLLSLLMMSKLKKDNITKAILILPVLIYHLLLSFSSYQFGYRYLLHLVPLILIFASGITTIKFEARKFTYLLRAAIVLLSIWYLISSILIYPHYLSYFNEFIGSKNAYYHLVDSNLDWGQDLYYLSAYLLEQGISEPYISYYGFPETVNYPIPEIYIPHYKKPGCEQVEGIVAISVTNLMKNQSCYSYLLSEQPINRIGYSILVYNITNR